MKDNDPVLSHILERDIDLLLIEELLCSSDFQKWFFTCIEPDFATQSITDLQVRHSVIATGEGGGETDIHVSAVVGGRRVHVLVEDKVHSPFTSAQPERYRVRAEIARARAECDTVYCVLVCPAGYSTGSAPDFDRLITYEAIREKLLAQAAAAVPELATRLRHRCCLIQQAIDRLKRGHVGIPVAEVTSIWQAYYGLASKDYRELKMSPPGEKPGDSYSVSFFCLGPLPGLPKCRIEHVMENGTVTLLVPGWGQHRQRLAPRIAASLPPSTLIREAGKSLGLYAVVAKLRRLEAADAQIPNMRQAMETARQLKGWYEKHGHLLALPDRTISD